MTKPINAPITFGFVHSNGKGVYYKNGVRHKGIDFSNGREGDAVMSCLPGIVTHVGYGGWGSAYGQHVIIRSVFGGRNVWGIYAHLKTENVSYGQTIKAGQKIGTNGGAKGKRYSGNSTGPHMHCQFCTTNAYSPNYINPAPMIAWQPTAAHTAAPLASKLDPKIYKEGAVGEAITWLGTRLTLWLNAYHIDPPYSEGPGPTWGTADRAAVKLFQERILGATGVGADGYPGALTLHRLEMAPPVIAQAPHMDVETISANLAAYDVKVGLKNRVKRSDQIIHSGLTSLHSPLWWHFQECSEDMMANMRKHMPDYQFVSQGGRGRQSAYRKGQGITILEAKLVNVKHMLRSDTKEMLVIAWGKDGYEAVEVNFHSENEGTVVQPLQLLDAIREGQAMAAKHGVPNTNIFITGDTNFQGNSAFAAGWQWHTAYGYAKKKIKMGFASINNWKAAMLAGKPIDADIVYKTGTILEVEQLTKHVVSDHWPHRCVRRIFKKAV